MKTRFAGVPLASGAVSSTACAVLAWALIHPALAQVPGPDTNRLQTQIETLTEQVSRVEAQLQQSQRELAALRQELGNLRTSAGIAPPPAAGDSSSASELATAVAEIRETQVMQAAQIATLDQSKVESASKYPVRISGMLVANAFVNTRQVDMASTPSVALNGSGSTGTSVKQTTVGLDMNGPALWGAETHADLRLDMSASASGSGYSGSYALGLVRLRTAHVDLDWDRAHAFFALDRPVIVPESPSSLTAVALPPLAWSGNLWAWNPQVGLSLDALRSRSGVLRVQAALIDPGDPPPLYASAPSGTYTPPSTSELSRWPGVEGRVAFESQQAGGFAIGAGGYYASHRSAGGYYSFDSWAATADFRVAVLRSTQLSGNAYWGSALGNLGGGAYKDYVALNVGGEFYYQTLDDRGGWIEWKQRAGRRFEFNEAFGIDNVPAHQLRPYATSVPVSEYNLARNRTITGNVIYSPNAYLLFSLEYRRILSSYVTSPSTFSDVIGIGAGYRF